MRNGADAIHRVIEQRAAAAGDAPAIIAGAQVMSYRDLNQRANALARRLMGAGLRRGAHVVTRLHRSPELVVTLLAALKAGGVYTWVHPGDAPTGIWIGGDVTSIRGYDFVDIGDPPISPAAASPNLPVMVRSSDIACLLPDHGRAPRAVCHGDVIATCLGPSTVLSLGWSLAANPLGVWSTLMTGATLALPAYVPLPVAA